MNTSYEFVRLNDISVSTKSLGHLGLISAYYEELGLRDFFDALLPKTRSHKISHGTAALAFLLNGLSFARRQLYLFPEFFSNLPVSRLFGEGVEPEHLNDAVMGELLDRIYAFGPTELFERLVFHILSREKLDLSRLHVDTTNFSVYGDYEADPRDSAPEKPVIELALGHPKDGRWELKRFVLSLLVNADGIPLFMKTHSGNASDHQTIKEAMDSVCTSLRDSDSGQKHCFIADAAFYTRENISNLQAYWVSRVPATLNESKAFLHDEVKWETDLEDNRYAFYETESDYANVKQKWVIVHSAEMSAKMKKTFDRHLEKQFSAGCKALTHLKNKEFACEADALAYAYEWGKKYPLLRLTDLSSQSQHRREPGMKGRPKKNEPLTEVWRVDAKLEVDTDSVAKEEARLGRFILASNDTGLSGHAMLSIYKEQMHVERGFRFLKNKSFLVSETYLKKPQRIEALALIMVLCLMIYSLLEHRLRQSLEKKGLTIPNRLGKPTSKPTLEWAFSFFSMIMEASVFVAGVTKNVNLTQPGDRPTVAKILSALGSSSENFYSSVCT
jgi:transposase